MSSCNEARIEVRGDKLTYIYSKDYSESDEFLLRLGDWYIIRHASSTILLVHYPCSNRNYYFSWGWADDVAPCTRCDTAPPEEVMFAFKMAQ
ncbi:MAG: hypothetical protein ACXABY_17670 [Candidatus Thorarchaeota archaeon]|jgi:hypothetical protein